MHKNSLSCVILAASPVFLAAATLHAADTIRDDTYSLPEAIANKLDVDAATQKMEKAASVETLAAFAKEHPRTFWLFGEDRQLAVRKNLPPAHWFQGGGKQFGTFVGTVRPGEFYVCQVCVLAGERKVCMHGVHWISLDIPGRDFRVINNPSIKLLSVVVQVPADASPQDMLEEMSGIPFGLMSEMLDHPNPWHGMVFGMRVRWPWSGDPRERWKLEDRFGIRDAEFIGWWDAACPVATGRSDVKASVFRRKDKMLIAVASWAKEPVEVKLKLDLKRLGLDRCNLRLIAPAIKGFQEAKDFGTGGEIAIAPGKGCLIIAEEAEKP